MQIEERKALAKRLQTYAAEYEKIRARAAGIGRMVDDMLLAAGELAKDDE